MEVNQHKVNVLDFDDFTDEMNGLTELIHLKKCNPALRVTLFCIYSKTSDAMLSILNELEWIEPALHGYDHSQHECLSWPLHKALKIFARAEIRGFAKVFRAPYWSMSSAVYKAAVIRGWVIADHDKNKKMWPAGLLVFSPRQSISNNYHFAHGHFSLGLRNTISDRMDVWRDLSGEFLFISEAANQYSPNLPKPSIEDFTNLVRRFLHSETQKENLLQFNHDHKSSGMEPWQEKPTKNLLAIMRYLNKVDVTGVRILEIGPGIHHASANVYCHKNVQEMVAITISQAEIETAEAFGFQNYQVLLKTKNVLLDIGEFDYIIEPNLRDYSSFWQWTLYCLIKSLKLGGLLLIIANQKTYGWTDSPSFPSLRLLADMFGVSVNMRSEDVCSIKRLI